MTVILVPFHLDEPLPAFAPPVAPDQLVTPGLPAGTPWERMAAIYGEVARSVEGVVRAGRVPVVQSGDCTPSLGVVAGVERAGGAPARVWVDAHGDVQTPEASASGYLGGMPLRQLVGGAHRTVPDRLGLRAVAERDVLLVDARDLDPPERDYLDGSAIRRTSMDEVGAAVPGGPLHLHVDMDVIDPRDVDGLLFPVPGGPRLPEVVGAVRGVLATGRVVSVTLGCTWGPGGGSGGLAALVAELGG